MLEPALDGVEQSRRSLVRDAWILIIVLAVVQGLRKAVVTVVSMVMAPFVVLLAVGVTGALILAENVRTKWLTSG